MDIEAAEDDGYSDDDLDALPQHTFHKLQQDAVKSTQKPNSTVQLLPLRHSPQIEQQETQERLVQTAIKLSPGNIFNGPDPPLPSSDYGDFDDEMLDGEIFDAAEQRSEAVSDDTRCFDQQVGESTQREHWRQHRYGVGQLHEGVVRKPQSVKQQTARATFVLNRDLQYEGMNDEARSLVCPPSYDPDPQPPSPEPARVDNLEMQVEKLIRQREKLQQAVETANASAFSKAGEIAIVRANANKVEKEFEARARTLERLQADEVARQKIELDKVRDEFQKIATEKEFLENDLAEGTKEIRNLRQALKRGTENSGKERQPATPRKNRSLPLRDGFDDDEIQPMSPSKLVLRSKASTPKAGAKRKRKPFEDSPVKPLELGQSEDAGPLPDVDQIQANVAPAPIVQAVKKPDHRFKFTQAVLNHRLGAEDPRTFERLTSFTYPSAKDQPLSTILLDRMSELSYKQDVARFPAAIGLILISLWWRCMDEGYHEPVHLLVDLVKYVLFLNPVKLAPDLTNELMGLVQSTADIILIPRCKKQPARKDRADIDSTVCLQIMQIMAYDCQCEDEEIVRFWRTMRFDFVMMLLNFINPLEEIHIMLRILRTSVLENSFAMIIPPNNGQQDASEAHVIDNLSHLLINNPRPPDGAEPPDAVDLCDLRLEVLSLFEIMCENVHSAEALAKHRLVVGCLVRVMNDELNRVYDHHRGHEQRVALVNMSTRMLYRLTVHYSQLINMQAKLSVIPGGQNKYLIALTRLAFSEGGFYEQDIEDDVVDCAHQMLEARVSPEEAEQLVEAFGSTPLSRK